MVLVRRQHFFVVSSGGGQDVSTIRLGSVRVYFLSVYVVFYHGFAMSLRGIQGTEEGGSVGLGGEGGGTEASVSFSSTLAKKWKRTGTGTTT